MESSRWEQVQSLFHEATELPAAERLAFLEAASGGDKQLLAVVLTLLEEDASPASFLDRNVAGLADKFLKPLPPGGGPEFGPYRIGRLLGEGGMGVVYLAKRADLGNEVAIKFLRDAWMSPARRERFTAEQRILAKLTHPAIARLYDADTLRDGTPWFVMEYVEGSPLTDYCREHKSPMDERLRLFRSICEAVHYAHRHAVIHRDLKPSNILVKSDGTPRLLDFGISKQLLDSATPVDQTKTGLRLMTPAYAAPEQVRGEAVGIFTDVYSLGVILYELLTGQHPLGLSDQTPAEAMKLILEREPEKPSAVAGGATRSKGAGTFVPVAGKAAWADLDVLCLTAMHKDPQRR